MEKEVETIARYHYKRDYYVEVDSQGEYGKNRDYWLCKRGEKRKLFMFSAIYKDADAEERRILSNIEDMIVSYENTQQTKYA